MMTKSPTLRLAIYGLTMLSIANVSRAQDWRVATSFAPPEFAPLVVRQSEDYTCGAAALANLFLFQFGKNISENEIARRMLGARSNDIIRMQGGFSLLDMVDFADAHGFVATGERDLTLDQLIARVPAIIQINAQRNAKHFVVVLESRDGRFAIADPAMGGLWVSAKDLKTRWSGITLVLSGA